MTLVETWFDGACEPRNPGGHASFGALVKVDGVLVWSQAGYIGFGPQMSSNVAEYQGAIACMKHIFENMPVVSSHETRVKMRGDSMLVVNQLNGEWKVKRGLYVPHYRVALALRTQFTNLVIEWVPRAQNAEADALSKQALRERQVEFRIQRD